MKWKLEHTILLLFLCAGTAAAALGVFAFRLARHEEAFQKQQMANLLRSECKIFAERCRDTLDSIKETLIRKRHNYSFRKSRELPGFGNPFRRSEVLPRTKTRR